MSWWRFGQRVEDLDIPEGTREVPMTRLAFEIMDRTNQRLHEDMQRSLALVESLAEKLLELKRDGFVIEGAPAAPGGQVEDEDDLPEEVVEAIDDQQFRLPQKRQVRAWARRELRGLDGEDLATKVQEVVERIQNGDDYEGPAS